MSFLIGGNSVETKQHDIYERMAILWTKQNAGDLTEDEGQELDNLLKANADTYWEKARCEVLAQLEEGVNRG
jgi:hypothetical protein